MSSTATVIQTGLTIPTGYRMSAFKQMTNARGGVAWSATLKREGAVVAQIGNDGHGGCNDSRFTSPAERDNFRETAERIYPDETFEVEDLFAEDLSTIADLSRKRGAVFFTSEDDPTLGEFRVLPAKYGPEAVLAYLRTPAVAAKRPMLLDRTEGVFKPVV